ncbi:MAG TPA: hypothetical protein VGI19_04765 [Candidatus Cybelea sp.]|jgi:hypothetical protein
MKKALAVAGVCFALLVGVGIIIGGTAPQRQVALAQAERHDLTLRSTFSRYASLCAGHGPLAALQVGRIRMRAHPAGVRTPIADRLGLPIGRITSVTSFRCGDDATGFAYDTPSRGRRIYWVTRG